MIANCPSAHEWHRDLRTGTRAPIAFGIIVLVAWIGGFGIWATTAPIDSAVVASGTFVASSQNKVVQHLEGGIVRNILVKEGDVVEEGQRLMQLDDTAAQARHKRLLQRQSRLLALQARLLAELTQAVSISFPAELRAQAATDNEIAELIDRQRSEFEVRRLRLAGEVELLKHERAGHQETLAGLSAQLKSAQEQIALFQRELADKNELLERALVRRSEVLATQRAEARAIGDLGQITGRIGDTNERIARTDQQIIQLQSVTQQRANEELRAVESELDDIREQIRAARDVVDRVELVAPVRGVIVKLNFNTHGGVIPPGATIFELVPIDDDLIIETRVSPTDVVHVKPGQQTQVRLTTANQRTVPFVDGKVSYVSADAVSEPDARRGQPTTPGAFIVRVKLHEADLKAKVPEFRQIPGTPVELFINIGERTFFSYLMRPVIDSFSRAFREQ